MDSTGIKVRGEGEWHARKHGGARRRVWRKVHLAMDAATLEVRAVEGEQANAIGSREPANDSRIGDAPMLAVLPSQIPESETIASVIADGAYDGRACRNAVGARGAEAIIPPRRNAKPWKKDILGARGRDDDLRAMKRFGRTL